MHKEKRGNVGLHDPKVGDTLLVDDEAYKVIERCSCGKSADHVRWFLEGQMELASLVFPQAATLAKEWDEDGDVWWWFGRRIAASEVSVGRDRLSRWIASRPNEVPETVRYDGKNYQLISETEPAPAASKSGGIPLTLWEYVDDVDVDSVLVEKSAEGDLTLYQGAYYDPTDLRLA